jgi:hypothetical protein
VPHVPDFLSRLVALPTFMRLSVKLSTGSADPREDETVLLGDLSLPQTSGWDTTALHRPVFCPAGKEHEGSRIPHLAKNERDMGHPLVCGTRTKNTWILFLLRKPHTLVSPVPLAGNPGTALGSPQNLQFRGPFLKTFPQIALCCDRDCIRPDKDEHCSRRAVTSVLHSLSHCPGDCFSKIVGLVRCLTLIGVGCWLTSRRPPPRGDAPVEMTNPETLTADSVTKSSPACSLLRC